MSLLNSDLKILAKTLASRFNPLVTKLIHPVYTRFIPDRHLLYFIMLDTYLISGIQRKSLDAEKAFDCVEFPYLHAVLEKFGLGTRFILWIKLLFPTLVPEFSLIRQCQGQLTHREALDRGALLVPCCSH